MSRPKIKRKKKREKRPVEVPSNEERLKLFDRLAAATEKLKKETEEEGLVGEDLGPCPFCDGRVGVVQTPGKQAVFHSMPMCEKFEAEDPMMFVHNMRMKVAGPQPDDDEWPFPVDQEPS